MIKNDVKHDIAKNIVLGINHFETMTEKIGYVSDVLDSYNLVEKEKSRVSDRVMGNKNTFEKAATVELEEDFSYEK